MVRTAGFEVTSRLRSRIPERHREYLVDTANSRDSRRRSTLRFGTVDGGRWTVDKKQPDPISGPLVSAVNYRLLVGTLDHGR